MPSYSSLKIASAAQALVDQTLARADTAANRTRIKEVLASAAATDLNRVLSAKEAQLVVDAFAPLGAGPLTADQIKLGADASRVSTQAMSALANLDGMSNIFTLQGTSVEKRMIQELKDSVSRANGRATDVNMLIFEFQSDAVEKTIIDLAKLNPNVTFRIIADSGQASESGGNALPPMVALGLPNLQVKYKKDFPYVWSDALKRPNYNHGSTSGLNHHKGFTTLIDGRPDTLLTGSFNWSSTADTKNYEDLTIFQNRDAASRGPIEQFSREFAGYWNNPNAALSPNDFKNFKDQQWNAMMIAHGEPPDQPGNWPTDTYANYVLPTSKAAFDVNGFTSQDEARLATVTGSKAVARQVISERQKFGRFSDLEDLLQRVPSLAGRITADEVDSIGFGSAQTSVNMASAEELDRAGLTLAQAKAVVTYRSAHGDFGSIDELVNAGVPRATVERLRESLTAVDVEVFFNSRARGDSAGGTGYGPDGSRLAMVADAHGVVAPTRASVVVAATDLFNRAGAGEIIDVAMYGANPTAPEFVAMIAAAKRGAKVRVVLNDDFTQTAVAALRSLANQGFAVEVRIQKAKTMHEKFGVVGKNVFFGSANFSESSSTKHSENRITVKNNEEARAAFQARFDELRGKSIAP